MESLPINDRYLIYKDGKVFSIKSNRFLNGVINDQGYKKYSLKLDGKKFKTYKGHRLVALAFIPNPENKPHVNHIDGNKLNNNVDNLEWCTSKENQEHAINVLKKKVYFQTGVKHHYAKLNKLKVREIRRKYKTGKYTFRGLAKIYGVSNLVINQVIHNRIWRGV